MPCSSELHDAAIGAHFCPRPKNRTFISRSFSSLCFNATRFEGPNMKRREFLQLTSGLSAHMIVGSSLLSIGAAEADTGLPIAALKAVLDPKKDLLLVHGDTAAVKFDMSFNKRTQIAPRVRV